jgi:short-subunit dehydrogenase
MAVFYFSFIFLLFFCYFSFIMSSNHKTALITGASSGIGKSLAESFAKDGYDVILAARSVGKMALQAADLRQRYGITATVIAADLASSEGAAKLYADIKNRGFSLNALANNAGFGVYGEFKDSSLESELAMMLVNMNAVVVLTKRFLPDLLAVNGKIINTASTAAFQPGPYMAVYYATKAFVLSFSEAMAAELEGTGVTVTALCPGPTASGFQDQADMHASALVKNKKLPAAERVATLGYRAMQRGQRVYIPGVIHWLMAQSVRFTPRRLVTTIVKAMSKPI